MARQKCTSRRRRWPRNAGQESNQKRLQHRVVDKHLARQRNRWLQARGRHARRTPVRVDFALIFISRICTPPFAQRFFWHIAAATVSGTAPSHNRIRSLASSSKSLRKYTESQPEVWTTLPVHASSVSAYRTKCHQSSRRLGDRTQHSHRQKLPSRNHHDHAAHNVNENSIPVPARIIRDRQLGRVLKVLRSPQESTRTTPESTKHSRCTEVLHRRRPRLPRRRTTAPPFVKKNRSTASKNFKCGFMSLSRISKYVPSAPSLSKQLFMLPAFEWCVSGVIRPMKVTREIPRSR